MAGGTNRLLIEVVASRFLYVYAAQLTASEASGDTEMRLRLISLIIACICSGAGAQDHLVPEDSVFTAPYVFEFEAYYADVVSAFEDVYDRDVFARMIVLPSFTPEYAVAVARDGDVFAILHVQPNHHIWDFHLLESYKSGDIRSYDLEGNPTTQEVIAELEEMLPESVDALTVEKCEIAITKELAETLYSLWAEMLFRTRYVDYRPVSLDGDETFTIGADGVTYHFGFEYGADTLTGKVWSPDEGTQTARFVEVAETMKTACLENAPARLNEVRAKAEALLAELNGVGEE